MGFIWFSTIIWVNAFHRNGFFMPATPLVSSFLIFKPAWEWNLNESGDMRGLIEIFQSVYICVKISSWSSVSGFFLWSRAEHFLFNVINAISMHQLKWNYSKRKIIMRRKLHEYTHTPEETLKHVCVLNLYCFNAFPLVLKWSEVKRNVEFFLFSLSFFLLFSWLYPVRLFIKYCEFCVRILWRNWRNEKAKNEQTAN